MSKWIIYYGDGSKVYDKDCNPEDVPRRDIQVITVEDEDVGQAFVRNSDYYWWDYKMNCWSGGDIFGLFDYLIEPGVKIVLFGRTITNDEYREILSRAMNETDGYMPRKSARHGWERK